MIAILTLKAHLVTAVYVDVFGGYNQHKRLDPGRDEETKTQLGIHLNKYVHQYQCAIQQSVEVVEVVSIDMYYPVVPKSLRTWSTS